MLSIKVKDAILTDSTNTILISIQLLKENPHMDYFQTEKTTETRQQRQQKRLVRNSIICTLSLSYQPNFVMSLLIGWLSSWFQNEPVTPELKKEIESTLIHTRYLFIPNLIVLIVLQQNIIAKLKPRLQSY